MGRSWDRYDASLEDIKRARKSILSQFSNATDIYYDEYLVDRHQNESCNANKFYYGAVMETKDGRFQAATSYGRIGEHLDSRKAFGGIKAFDEGIFTNFDSAKRKLNEKLDKKKRGKRCSKCKTRQSYSPFAPKNAEEYGAEENEGLYSNRAMEEFAKMKEEREDWQNTDPNQCSNCGGTTRWPMGKYVVCITCLKPLYSLQGKLYADAQPHWTGSKRWRNQFNSESMSPQVFGKLVGQYPQPPNNPSAVGGFMDEGFEWTVNQAENEELVAFGNGWYHTPLDEVTETGHMVFKNFGNDEEVDVYYARRQANDKGIRTTPNSYIFYSKNNKPIENESFVMTALAINREYGLKNMLAENEVFGSSNIVSKVKNNWLNSLIGLGVGLVAFDFLKKKGYVANADTLIESPNTGDLTPADYEEIVVESTGYAVPIIPVSLDGSFMGSRFHALPTDRYVYDSPEGIGANIDVAMKRNTTFLPNEQSLVQASEAPGQSPYNSMQPNGQENTDFPLRVIHETTTVSLDPSTAPFIPTDLSGYTGQQFIPTSVYEDMLGVGISGRIPSFSQPASGDIGSNHFGSRIANPDMLTNVGGPLKEDVNGDYTDGNITKSLSQWSIENQVQQISDTEAIVVERGSGGRKMIRRV
tara:strand:- start:508 stop:2430 length:1923 start_codon:yes stop_codon:yes gene_type:complete